ncbi:MAG TPA: ABC transporter permease [Geminicoccus sp.]|jgi:peptide/nickel transport system permease protein|uniref:ABC transporter permease n=1 Tax=Geminicoccus sp. TaxID=2024832 RepID=UPI002E363E83|nr:ABC transporter permease [Geminicoccus sp.]HEX2525786.1 ABC transporter permease [Geminicoccus sp.]
MASLPEELDTRAPADQPGLLTTLLSIRHSWVATLGFCLVLFWVVIALIAPYAAPYDPNAQDFLALANPRPSSTHLLGTDMLGRDMLSRVMWGARTVLTVAPIAVVVAYLIGAVMGLLAGYYGGWTDAVISRISDIVLSFPVIILYLIIIANFGASALNIIIAVTFTAAPQIMRIVRGLTLDIKNREYVTAAQIRGESAVYIMAVEILPNARGPLIVDACLRMGYTTIAIGVLGFLGLGLPPPDPDWGGMVKDSVGLMSIYPHMSLIPAAAISSLVIGFNLLADGIRELALRD